MKKERKQQQQNKICRVKAKRNKKKYKIQKKFKSVYDRNGHQTKQREERRSWIGGSRRAMCVFEGWRGEGGRIDMPTESERLK